MICGENAPYRQQVHVVVRPYPQPWHASSTLMHESALASARLALSDRLALEDVSRNAFWQYSYALFKAQERWFDDAVRDKTADQIRGELASLAVDALGERTSILELRGEPITQALRNWTRVGDGNAGSPIVPDLKYCIKVGRQNSIHITPTARTYHTGAY